MVLRKMPPPPKKLCPRCGSPMLTSEEGIRNCIICHFSEKILGKTATGIKISDEVTYKPIIKEEGPPIKIFKMVKDDIIKTDCLDSDHVCLITDTKQTKIWIWKGKFTSPGEVYRAGTAATRLKASERMYTAQTQMIDEENEPTDFPKIKKGKSGGIIESKPEVEEPEPELEKPEVEIKEEEPEIREEEPETKEAELKEEKEELEEIGVEFEGSDLGSE